MSGTHTGEYSMPRPTVAEVQEFVKTMGFKEFKPGDVIVATRTPLIQKYPNAGDICVVYRQHEPRKPKCDGTPLASSEYGDLLVAEIHDDAPDGFFIRCQNSSDFELATPEQIEAWENRPVQEKAEGNNPLRKLLDSLN